MCDPTDGAAEREQREACSLGKLRSAGEGRERQLNARIDAQLFAAERDHLRGGISASQPDPGEELVCPRVAVAIRRGRSLPEAGQPAASRQGLAASSPGAGAVGLAKELLDALARSTTVAAALERAESGQQDVGERGVGRGDATGGEGAGIELVIGAENQRGVEVSAMGAPASSESLGKRARAYRPGRVEELPDRAAGAAQDRQAGLGHRDRSFRPPCHEAGDESVAERMVAPARASRRCRSRKELIRLVGRAGPEERGNFLERAGPRELTGIAASIPEVLCADQRESRVEYGQAPAQRSVRRQARIAAALATGLQVVERCARVAVRSAR